MAKTCFLTCCVVAGAALLMVSGCGRSVSASPRPQSALAAEIRENLLSGAGESGGKEAAASTGTGWGTLRGKFTYAGDPPAPGQLTVTKDTEVCGAGGGITDNSLVVGPDKGISNVVVYARRPSACMSRRNRWRPAATRHRSSLTRRSACSSRTCWPAR